MPGYVALVAAVHALGGGLLAIKMIGVVAGGLTAGAVYGIARLLFGGAHGRRRGPDVRAVARGDRGRERHRHGHAGDGVDRGRRLAAGSRVGAASAGRAAALRSRARPGGVPARGRVAPGGAGRAAFPRARRGAGPRHHPHAGRVPGGGAGAAALGHPQQDALRRVLPDRQPWRAHRAGRFQSELGGELQPVAEPPVRGGDRLSSCSRPRIARAIARPSSSPCSGRRRSRNTRSACWRGRPIGCSRTNGRCCTGRSTGRACCRRRAARLPGSPPIARASNASSTGSGTCSSPPCWWA